MSLEKSNIWYYQDAQAVWIPFKDIDNEILEEGYARRATEIELDDAWVDLDRQLRRDKHDATAIKPIKRQSRQLNDTTLRAQRFCCSPKLVKSFTESDANDHRFIKEWQRHHRRMSTEDLLDHAAEGIRQEGQTMGQKIEADWIAGQLHSCKSKSKEEIDRCIVSLYTRESFLYRLVNKTLRDNDHSKLNTLGAFCQLLFRCDCSPTMNQYGYQGVLYRGAELDATTIQAYQQAIGTVKTWDAFSSTSKARAKAECFGNVLFIINRLSSTKYRFSGMDITSLSAYPEEEEVLIRAARNFLVEKVERSDETGKYHIFLSLC